MRPRIRRLAAVSVLAISLGLAVAPTAVFAGPPTEISVTPGGQYLGNCYYGGTTQRAYWTVTVQGGSSGSFSVSAVWGDGLPGGSWTVPGPYGEFDTHHDFACGHGQRNQTWSASRGGGGGTGHDYTWAQTY
jgi:hypothetical protein